MDDEEESERRERKAVNVERRVRWCSNPSQFNKVESGVRNLRMGGDRTSEAMYMNMNGVIGSAHMRKYRKGNTPCPTPEPFVYRLQPSSSHPEQSEDGGTSTYSALMNGDQGYIYPRAGQKVGRSQNRRERTTRAPVRK
jgi:hypothetical protein